MSKHSKEDIIRIADEQGVEFFRLQFTDIFGQLKNVTVTRSQLNKVMANEVMIDGSSIAGFTRIHESDQYLHPDLDSFTILPWHNQADRIARFICDVYDPNGNPFIGDPRYVLKQEIKKAEAMGFDFNVGPECEFFLFETDDKGRPTTQTSDQASYFDLGPLDLADGTRREICLALEDMGFEIEASHHEVARGQHEIDFKYGPALKTADNIMTFKLAVKTIAQKNGLHATFMPKPIAGINGSGMHTNMSLFHDGVNVFADPSDALGLSKQAYAFIAGLLKHVQAMAAITNPLVNSYKRLVPGYEAPCYLAWSASNRSAMIRIPATRGQTTRVELRCPDPTCNPYLALAVCLAAGLDGIEKGMVPPAEETSNIFEMDAKTQLSHGIASMPGNLMEALTALKGDQLMLDTLGPHVCEKYFAGKLKEWDSYRTQVTDWELDRYMVLY